MSALFSRRRRRRKRRKRRRKMMSTLLATASSSSSQRGSLMTSFQRSSFPSRTDQYSSLQHLSLEKSDGSTLRLRTFRSEDFHHSGWRKAGCSLIFFFSDLMCSNSLTYFFFLEFSNFFSGMSCLKKLCLFFVLLAYNQ